MTRLSTLHRTLHTIAIALACTCGASAFTYTVQPSDIASLHVARIQPPSWGAEYYSRILRDRSAILMVTPVGAPLATADNPHPTGVFFDGSAWAIYNQDFAPMPIGAAFNVVAFTPSPTTFVHRIPTSTTVTYLEETAVTEAYSPRIFITANWNPGGGGSGVYNNHKTAVYFDVLRGKWAILNEDRQPFTAGASFNVVVRDAPRMNWFRHTTSASTISGNESYFQSSPDAAALYNVKATHDASPIPCEWCFFVTPVTNDHVVGIRYNPARGWAVYNVDGAPMQAGLVFNIEFEPIP